MTSQERIYLDYASTTPIDKRVLKAMYQYFEQCFGNASSLHSFGTLAKDALDKSRAQIAEYIRASSAEELIFTSGGTESNNFAIKGVAFANRNRGNHIIVSSIEHDCVLNACRWLETQGFYVTYLPVDSKGSVDLDFLRRAINPTTILVSVMYANNEIGTIQPVYEIGKICKEKNVLFHSDACQSFGKVPVDVNINNIDLLTINAHKISGPKGVGALYVRKGTNITPLLHGGGQEAGLRSTTENIPAIIGFANAASLCIEEMESESARLSKLRQKLSSWLLDNFENAYINGDENNHLPGLINFSFHGQEGETIRLLLLLDEQGFAVSAGSACSSNHGGSASHVLEAIGLNPFEARGGIRVSMGRLTTEEDIKRLCKALKCSVLQMISIYS